MSADPLRVVLLGPPGAGKGTQAEPLCDTFDLAYVATGELLRDQRRRDTALGREAKQYMEQGHLVPDELVTAMVRERLQDEKGGFLLDGFPRSLAQAEALDGAVAITGALLIDVPDETLVERIGGRRQCPRGHVYHVIFNPPQREGICDVDGEPLSRRDDDAPETVRERLRVYHETTAPVVEHYDRQGVLVRADGTRPPDEVQRELVAALRAVAG
jgi:adenylate kinase